LFERELEFGEAIYSFMKITEYVEGLVFRKIRGCIGCIVGVLFMNGSCLDYDTIVGMMAYTVRAK
jgi:hypothetical protein